MNEPAGVSQQAGETRPSILTHSTSIIAAVVAAAVGAWLGARLRTALSREEPLALNLLHELPDGRQALAMEVDPVRLGVALLPALFGRPRWPVAFLLGVVSGALPNQPLRHQVGSFSGQIRSELP